MPDECLADPVCYDENLHIIIRHQVFISCQVIAVAVYIVLFLKLWSFIHFVEAVRLTEFEKRQTDKEVSSKGQKDQKGQHKKAKKRRHAKNSTIATSNGCQTILQETAGNLYYYYHFRKH